MSDPDLEQRLQRLDPMPPSASVDPVDGPRARALLEQIMNTTLEETEPSTTRRWWMPAIGAAAAALAVAAGVAAWSARSSDADPVSATFPLPASDTLAMCLAITDMPPPPAGSVAFGGTVTEVTDTDVTIDVDQMYAGDELDVVTLATGPEVTTVALDGVEFRAGERYLVTVADGQVMTCGVSGPASPELEAVYERWYGA